MRLLVECPECQRQYDAGDLAPGSRFHCDCTAVVEVQSPVGHDARVVRCASCGAPRQNESEACDHCLSDFTLHERDLHTVCPHCLARVSDSAKFCHHCGTGLVPELEAGHATELNCPACQDRGRLTSRRLGAEEVTVLECGACAGMWLGQDAFDRLVQRARREAVHRRVPPAPIRPKTRSESGGPFYRPCAICGELMNRRHYASGSGVIIDLCRGHGIWFDAEELSAILTWLRAGGQAPTALVRDRLSTGVTPHAQVACETSNSPLLGVLELVTGLFVFDRD